MFALLAAGCGSTPDDSRVLSLGDAAGVASTGGADVPDTTLAYTTLAEVDRYLREVKALEVAEHGVHRPEYNLMKWPRAPKVWLDGDVTAREADLIRRRVMEMNAKLPPAARMQWQEGTWCGWAECRAWRTNHHNAYPRDDGFVIRFEPTPEGTVGWFQSSGYPDLPRYGRKRGTLMGGAVEMDRAKLRDEAEKDVRNAVIDELQAAWAPKGWWSWGNIRRFPQFRRWLEANARQPDGSFSWQWRNVPDRILEGMIGRTTEAERNAAYEAAVRHILTHELLHAVGLTGHVSAGSFDLDGKEDILDNSGRLPSQEAVDRNWLAVQRLYDYRSLAGWDGSVDDEHGRALDGEDWRVHGWYGIDIRNGVVVWPVFGGLPALTGEHLRSNAALEGGAEWRGGLVGMTRGRRPVVVEDGTSHLVYTATVDDENLEAAFGWQGRVRARYPDVDMGVAGTLYAADRQGTMSGAFHGTGEDAHRWAAGELLRTDITAAWGAERTVPEPPEAP